MSRDNVSLEGFSEPLNFENGEQYVPSYVYDQTKPRGPVFNSACEEAHKKVHGEKRDDYGSVSPFCQALALKWTATLGFQVDPRLVWIMMVDFKTVREQYKPKRDNRVDIAGYAEVGEMFEAGL